MVPRSTTDRRSRHAPSSFFNTFHDVYRCTIWYPYVVATTGGKRLEGFRRRVESLKDQDCDLAELMYSKDYDKRRKD